MVYKPTRRQALAAGLSVLGLGGGVTYYLTRDRPIVFDHLPTHGRLVNPEPKQKIGYVTKNNLDEVVESCENGVAVVEFGSKGCMPCRAVKPVLEGVASEYDPEKMRFWDYNIASRLNFKDTPLDGIYKAIIPKVAVIHHGKAVKVFWGDELFEGRYVGVTEEMRKEIERQIVERMKAGKEGYNLTEEEQVIWKLHFMGEIEEVIKEAEEAKGFDFREIFNFFLR